MRLLAQMEQEAAESKAAEDADKQVGAAQAVDSTQALAIIDKPDGADAGGQPMAENSEEVRCSKLVAVQLKVSGTPRHQQQPFFQVLPEKHGGWLRTDYTAYGGRV